MQDFRKAFRKFSRRIDPSARIITSQEEKIVPYSESQDKQGAVGKPNGLWYGCGNAWLEWCLGEEFGFGGFVHQIEIDPTNIKFIPNVEEFDEFSKEYGLTRRQYFLKTSGKDLGSEFGLELDETVYYGIRFRPDYIDWARVAASFSGIEINPYLWDRRLDGGMWYYGWDCASGCIWDASIIVDTRLIAGYDEKRKKVVKRGTRDAKVRR